MLLASDFVVVVKVVLNIRSHIESHFTEVLNSMKSYGAGTHTHTHTHTHAVKRSLLFVASCLSPYCFVVDQKFTY